MTNVKSLLEMYVKMGGSLTDTYADIAGGVPVGQYSTISDAILACSKKYSAGGGGGAEKFVVTLTKTVSKWVAGDGVTIADVIEAYGDGKKCVAIINFSTYSVEAPLTICVEQASTVVFAAATYLQSNYIVSAMGDGSGNSDSWVVSNCEIADELPSFTASNNGQVLGVSSGSLAWVDSNAPLIVTMTYDSGTSNLVGDKTYKEIYDAFSAGQSVVCKGVVGSTNVSASVLAANDTSGEEYILNVCASGSIAVPEGTANEYFTLHVGN